MLNKRYIFISALVGLLCGFMTIHSFFAHSWTSILLWIAVGFILVLFVPNRRTAVYTGIVFGFVDIATWLYSGFQGTAGQLWGLTIVVVITGALGAVIGAVGAIIFYRLFRR